MAEPAQVLVVAHKTAATPALVDAIRARAEHGPARFHLVVPRQPRGLHKVVDPEDVAHEEAEEALALAIPPLSEAAGTEVTGAIGDADPLAAIQDAVNLGHFDEILLSTLPRRFSRWLRMDLVSKARGLGLPVVHVEAADAPPPAVSTS